MDHIFGAELWLLAADDPAGEGHTGGLLLIATPTGKHWHWLPAQEYEDTAHLHAMALHYIGTLGLDEMTVRECTTTEVYLLSREDDGQASETRRTRNARGDGAIVRSCRAPASRCGGPQQAACALPLQPRPSPRRGCPRTLAAARRGRAAVHGYALYRPRRRTIVGSPRSAPACTHWRQSREASAEKVVSRRSSCANPSEGLYQDKELSRGFYGGKSSDETVVRLP